MRSALVLKALTDARPGAVAAAATTSLPEHVGGVRNFDHRYAWMRDASTMIAALYDIGYTAEADAFMGWLARATAGTAAEQFQLDVYGELVETVWRCRRHGRDLTEETIHLLEDVLPQLEQVWTEPDAGVWEQRGDDQPFVSAKIFARRAADLLGELAEDVDGLDVDPQRCRELRDEIRADVERSGVDRTTNALVRAFGRHTIDASNLLAILMTFWPIDDPRAEATIDEVEQRLADGARAPAPSADTTAAVVGRGLLSGLAGTAALSLVMGLPPGAPA